MLMHILSSLVAQRLNVCLQCGRPGFDPWVRKIPWRREWQATPVFLPGKSHGWRSLAGPSPWGCKELDTIERLTHTMEYYSAIKKNVFESVLMRWMKLEPIIQSEVRKTPIQYTNAYIWNLERW